MASASHGSSYTLIGPDDEGLALWKALALWKRTTSFGIYGKKRKTMPASPCHCARNVASWSYLSFHRPLASMDPLFTPSSLCFSMRTEYKLGRALNGNSSVSVLARTYRSAPCGSCDAMTASLAGWTLSSMEIYAKSSEQMKYVRAEEGCS